MEIFFTVFVILVVILIVLAIRGLVNWYLKINERTELQKETNRLIKQLTKKISGE
jgi:CHASE1-domain containing sensor protein